ncbi:MAG: PQQ-binding-like beta-propeller repeat protein [Planctomycetota bacterium]
MAEDASDAGPEGCSTPGSLTPPSGCSCVRDLLLAATLTLLSLAAHAQPDDGGNLFEADGPAELMPADAAAAAPTDDADQAVAEPGVLLPGDRGRERLLDRARRLVADARWSDAAAALDELLADDRDAFVAGGAATTRGSIRSEAAALVQQLPRPGREAYERLFSGRAEKRLAAAIAADDVTAIVAVARRWLHTPAGRDAALIAAVTALEAGQPLAAAAWLERLAGTPATADLGPTLALLRAVAVSAAGDREASQRLLAEAARLGRSGVRLAGSETTIPLDAAGAAEWLAGQVGGAAGPAVAGREWRQFRGTPARNGVVEATRPLLVPRYRVPLVRHPEEARRLEKERQAALAAGDPLAPAGTPLAVGDRLVVQTALGILAVDFESGRRLWLASGVAATEVDADASAAGPPRVFRDATSGNLASDGRLVFAVEGRPEAFIAERGGGLGAGRLPFGGIAASWDEGNMLSAYELSTGAVRWRLQGRNRGAEEGRDEAASRWHLGPPLVVGDELFVLVEERGEVRVEARSADDAALRWVQPLATYDDGDAISSAEAAPRRLAGLTPALAEGVLVCPIGGGSVVAIDVATRSLLWAHAYPRPESGRDRGGFRAEPALEEPVWPGEPAPVIAADRVILAPFDANLLLCLGLRDGRPIWQRQRPGRIAIAGGLDDRLLVVDAGGVEALDLGTGKRLWDRRLGDGVRPSGRGILTPRALLLPSDGPGVLEIALDDGSIVGRSAGRGGGIPGNLVAHRGEVISRGVDSLDVFHQDAALEGRIETARTSDPDSPWAAYWRGQAAIDSGDVQAGLDALAVAAAATDFTIPPGDLAAAVVSALQIDFPAAARRWAEFPAAVTEHVPADVDRAIVDGFLARADAPAAWEGLRRLLATRPTEDVDFLHDPADPRLTIAVDRWLRSRLERLTAAADEPLRRAIDEACRELLTEAAATTAPALRRRRLATIAGRLGPHPALESFRGEVAAPDDAPTASPMIPLAADTITADSAWPLGRVERRDMRGDGEEGTAGSPPQLRPLQLTLAAGVRSAASRAAIDASRQQLIVTDDLGRRLTPPLTVAGLGGGFGLQFLNQSGAVEVAAAERLLFVRSTAGLFAYELGGRDGRERPLWTAEDLGTLADDPGARWGPGIGGRVVRDGGVPLGMRIGEPDDRPRAGGRGLTALPQALIVPGQRSVAVLDPASGDLLWRRDQLPAGLEWFVDGEFLCGCTADGRGSLVLATSDGRLVHALDVPHRRQRLAGLGRRFVVVQPVDEPALPAILSQVRLDLVDPADREVRPLGVFHGQGRAAETGDGRLAVLEPDGLLTVFDLADGGVVFRSELPAMPRRCERLHVQAWQDRYLVLAGSDDVDDQEAADISPLEPLLFSGGAAAPLSGAVWAVDRDDGRPLWPMPAVVERHCLHTAQPPGLPLLVFCRIIQPRASGQPSLGVLCLDKRTGHAVFDDDRIRLEGPTAGSCELTGDPDDHTVTIGDAGIGGGRLVLAFTGGPMAPRPPFQNRGRPLSRATGIDLIGGELEGRRPDVAEEE